MPFVYLLLMISYLVIGLEDMVKVVVDGVVEEREESADDLKLVERCLLQGDWPGLVQLCSLE